MFHDFQLEHMLVLSAILFTLGIYTVLTRKNAIAILMGVELMLNSANINFVAFSRYVWMGDIAGQVFAVFVIIVAAAEAAIGLAIVIGIFRNFGKVDVDKTDLMKG